MDNKEHVVLTDGDGNDLLNNDGTVRTMDKMEAHRRGLRHRAVSVFVFNSQGDLLLQRRAPDKYHSPGRWTNTCCTHCRQGEVPSDTAVRRLREEMGLQCCLREVFSFSYHADVGNGMIENEFDHVFVGECDESPTPDSTEISDWKWMTPTAIRQALVNSPEQYTYWLRYCFADVLKYVTRDAGSSC
jgi:isopentenyl-diphosphate delta-isomerase